MHVQMHLLPLTFLLTLASGHFDLVEPRSRGSDHDKLAEFPCGGLPASSQRTQVSLTDPELNIALKMGHDHSAVQVLLALGSDPGTNFNITLVPTFAQIGLGDFCLPDVELSEEKLGTRLTEGMEATLQVVTNGDPTGGLYNCADLVFTASASDDSPDGSCKNGTGVTASPFPTSVGRINANESTANGERQGGSGGGNGDNNQGGKNPSGSAAASLQTAAWGVLGVAVLAAGALL
ncbi:expression library immunization antigen 1 [Histoplasma capsulatum var. duboisii H88]|uniref:Expression library immunization antigen 1 n=2 Tax=Ajellomyces capsulatus TaxID=5037 RepID=F0UVI0_AJEC8|nr:expression library immunization antigen 1 [Histoplasma capsulatum H143]EGC49907.1 expression library immunization antigen 1 [Histoplasma capsulatum var. duboisii H88]QSS50889.1 expression library immunization antigen 1 [Histoplasma capsulatum var. duboisii H88]